MLRICIAMSRQVLPWMRPIAVLDTGLVYWPITVFAHCRVRDRDEL